MSGRASKEKGKRGERDFRDKLREHGFTAERGWADSIDIDCDLPFHFEVKFGGAIRLRMAYSQALADCGRKTPVVAHRSSRRGLDPDDLRATEPWMITLSADDFLKLVQQLTNKEKETSD